MTVSPWLTFEKLKELQTQTDNKPDLVSSTLQLYADKVNGDDSNDGLTPETAVENFEKALEIAKTKQYVASSTFQPSVTINLADCPNTPGQRYTTGDDIQADNIPRIRVEGSGKATCFVELGSSGLSYYCKELQWRNFTVPSSGSTLQSYLGSIISHFNVDFLTGTRFAASTNGSQSFFGVCDFQGTYGSTPFNAIDYGRLTIASSCTFTGFDLTSGSASVFTAERFGYIKCDEPIVVTQGKMANSLIQSYVDYQTGSSAPVGDNSDASSVIIIS